MGFIEIKPVMPPTLLVKGNLLHPNLPDVTPIDHVIAYVRKCLSEAPNAINPFVNRVLILEAKTASGKSVTVPPEMFILTQEFDNLKRKNVVCTQPRILTAQALAAGLDGVNYFEKKGMVFTLGKNLGYQTSAVSHPISEPGLIFVTLGTLEMQLQLNTPERFMRNYSVILIDEAHERQQILDSTIYQLKSFFIKNRSNPNLPMVILMSATFDVHKYAKFFEVGEDNIIRVSGFSFPIEERWPEQPYSDVLEAASQKVIECAKAELEADLTGQNPVVDLNSANRPDRYSSINRLLLFVPGIGENRKVIKKLRAAGYLDGFMMDVTVGGKKHKVRLLIDAMYIDSNAVKKVTADYIRIVGAKEDVFTYIMTSIHVNAVAETGLTLEDIKYVIDCGWSRESEFNPQFNIESILLSKGAAQSRIMQRRGRVGRNKPGVFVPLYPKAVFEALPKIQVPDIIQIDPTNLVLVAAALNGKFDQSTVAYMMDAPPKISISYAIHKLQMVGFLDQNCAITPSGRIASRLCNTISIQAISMILAGFTYETYIDDLIVMAVMMKYAISDQTFIGLNDDRVDELKKKNPKYMPPRDMPVDSYAALFDTIFRPEGSGLRHFSQDAFYKIYALFADDFIMSLLVFRAFEKEFAQLLLKADTTAIKMYEGAKKWCAQRFLKIDQMLNIYSDYVSIKSTLLAGGIDIIHGAQWNFVDALNEENMMYDFVAHSAPITPRLIDPIVKLKMCIYSGFKFNLLVYDDAIKNYRINYGGYPLTKTINFFNNNKGAGISWSNYEFKDGYFPDRLVCFQTACRENKSVNRYEVMAQGISIMSGFV